MRVHELAEELDLESNELIDFLSSELDVEVGNHMSGIDDDVVDLVRDHYGNGDSRAVEEEQTANDTGADTEGEDEELEEIEQELEEEEEEEEEEVAPELEPLIIRGSVTPEDLAERMGIETGEAVQTLMGMDVMASANDTIGEEAAELLAEEFGYELEFEQEGETLSYRRDFELDIDEVPEDERIQRPPVVTIMGHVDHGKTQLLDTIREANVVAGESGGITQHIGAWEVTTEADEDIVFIDTPGHEAFTSMRARGAQVTDLVVLVVAADDGVMPRTVESINHARAADVPIVVAINKMDLPEADADRVRQQLSEHELIPEGWGGDTIMVELSALEGDGVDELLEMIDLQADMMELTTGDDLPVKGTVIEAEVEQGMGPVATVLIQQGRLEKRQAFVTGVTYGKVRALINSAGERVDEIEPGSPVQVLGFDEVPEPGDFFEEVESESEARDIAKERLDELKDQQQEHGAGKVTLDQLQEFLEEGKIKSLNIVIKADTQGSTEVLKDSFESFQNEEVEATVVHTGVGGITESDVMLADASDGMIVGFNVRPGSRARKAANEKGIEIKTYSVIYEAIQDIREALEGMLEPEVEEQVLGHAEVREVFDISGVGSIAGCYVEEGTISRNARARVIRDGVIVHDGDVGSLKRFKEDVTEVEEGYECGVGIEDFNDVKEGDTIEVYRKEEVRASLEPA
ncbi:MAG: translation initiation factor IF-2 [bacterium]